MNESRPQLVIRIGEALYGLQIAPKATGETAGKWLDSYTAIDGAGSFNDGLANTDAMAAAGSTIGKWARSLEIDGFTDWYIPSRDELELLYRHYKPTAGTNHVYRAGDNPSSVPAGYPYTETVPAQTASDDFKAGGPEAFEDSWYWSSTQFSRYGAWGQLFYDGYQGDGGKSYEARVRAVRRFLIP